MADETDPESDAARDESDEVPDKYAMSSGERPEHIRKRNLITGLLLVLLVLIFVSITVYARAVGWS